MSSIILSLTVLLCGTVGLLALLALLSVLPNMSFVSVYKTMLAEQTGDNAWLNVRAPLTHLENTEAQTVRSGYRAIGSLLHNV